MNKIIKNVKISGRGYCVPENIVTNEMLEVICKADPSWVYDNLGIKERRVSSKSTTSSTLAVIAGQRAIVDAGLLNSDIQLIIVATSTPDYSAPSTACLVQNELHASQAVAFDISAVCSGFVYGVSVASQYIASGTYNNVLVIGSDTFSKITDWSHRDCVYFGDGAGAIVLSKGRGEIITSIHSDGKSDDAFIAKIGDTYTTIGRKIRNRALEILPNQIKKSLAEAGMNIADIDYFVPHQASINILKEIAKQINLPFNKCITVMDKYANIAGASIPIALCEIPSLEDKNVLMVAIGSGWTWGTIIAKQ